MGSDRADPPIFSLDVTTGDDGRTTVSVAGELDLATADAFSHAVRTGLATGAVIIDLREVTFMDSGGVRALNTALRESAEKGRELRRRRRCARSRSRSSARTAPTCRRSSSRSCATTTQAGRA